MGHCRPDVDNKPPQRFKHLEHKLKKQQMEEERFSQIERDNYLLLDKMSYIMTHPQLLDEKFMGAPVQFGKSLNKDFRKRGEQRVRGGSASCECVLGGTHSGRIPGRGEIET